MASSLRRTLAVRFSLTMGATLVAIALWVYAGMTRILRDQLDRSLHITFELQSAALAARGDILQIPAMDESRFLQQINRLVVGRDSTGRIVKVNGTLAMDLALDSAAFHAARAGQRTVTRGRWHGREVRSLYAPAPATPGGVAVLEIAASTEVLEARGREVLIRMLATSLLGSLASLAGAAWLTRSALEPVETIARQAAAVQGGRPGQRITAHADVIELRGLIEVLNQMLARLDRSYQWHRQIIRDLSHDLRTPIATLGAAVETALRTERGPEQYRATLASTLEEIDRLTLISDTLGLLAKLESGEVELTLVETDLRAVAQQAVDRARARVDRHEIRFPGPPEPLPARVDARLLGMVLDQLIDNARQHTPPGTRVAVTLAAKDGDVRLTVEDEGPGVPEEMLGQLFDRFYRGDPARGRQAGSGLGLTLAAAIVDLHSGRITAERGSPRGLRIRIELPRQSPVQPGSGGHEPRSRQEQADPTH